MSKTSQEVSNGLFDAINQAMTTINGSDANDSVKALLNSGQKKRKARTAKSENTDNTLVADNSLLESLGVTASSEVKEDNRPEWEKRSAKDHDEFCQWDLEKAKLKGYPEPEFDYRDFYETGDTLYYVRIFKDLGEKEIFTLKIRTIYPRMMVGVAESGYCICIGYADRDLVFKNRIDAKLCFNAAEVAKKEGVEFDEETGKKKRRKTVIVEDEDAEVKDDGEEMSDE